VLIHVASIATAVKLVIVATGVDEIPRIAAAAEADN
jgi:hypothetical protein